MGERSAEQQYLDDNYRIDTISDKRTALILCTSHGTWKDGTFEWENLSKSELIRAHFGKIIFLKDVYRHFYIEGLNPRINKISCIIRMLKENIGEGYRIVTAGFSGGVSCNGYRFGTEC